MKDLDAWLRVGSNRIARYIPRRFTIQFVWERDLDPIRRHMKPARHVQRTILLTNAIEPAFIRLVARPTHEPAHVQVLISRIDPRTPMTLIESPWALKEFGAPESCQ